MRVPGTELAAVLGMLAMLVCSGMAGAQAQAPPESVVEQALDASPPNAADDPGEAPEGESQAASTPEVDEAARMYLRQCSGCHTIGGGNLSGPDLLPTATWPRDQLKAAIKRMEKNVGPLTNEEVEQQADLLLDENAAQRLEQERERVTMRQAATLEPGSAETGEALFMGQRAFANGGLSCVACHDIGGWGGNFSVSLQDSFTRLGEAPLKSTIEDPGFPVMRAAYTNKPVTKQETRHLIAYLEQVAKGKPISGHPPVHTAGLIGAVAILGGLGYMQRNRKRGVRARLVNRANGRSRS